MAPIAATPFPSRSSERNYSSISSKMAFVHSHKPLCARVCVCVCVCVCLCVCVCFVLFVFLNEPYIKENTNCYTKSSQYLEMGGGRERGREREREREKETSWSCCSGFGVGIVDGCILLPLLLLQLCLPSQTYPCPRSPQTRSEQWWQYDGLWKFFLRK